MSSLTNLLLSRSSVRAFKSTPVPQSVLSEVFSLSRRAPSNCNVQPVTAYVVSGSAKASLSSRLVAAVSSGAPPNPDFAWTIAYTGIHRDRQFGSANALYGAAGIDRADKKGRQNAVLRNWQFFDAPHAAFFTMDKYLGVPGAVDVGIYAATLALALEERGISSCMQGALGMWPTPAREALGLKDETGILFGMSFGYKDENAPANKAVTDRSEVNDYVRFIS